MSRPSYTRIAERKAVLTARAQLERMQCTLAIENLRDTLFPSRPARPRGARPGRLAAAIVALGVPLLGRNKLSHALRTVSLALTGWRIVRNWNRRRS
jgi:hypothetical protein